MTTVFEVGSNGIWTGATRVIAPEDGLLPPWTRSPVPDLSEGEYAEFDGIGWRIVTALPRPVLPNLTMRQFRLGLFSAGLLGPVETAIAALDEPERTAAQIEFEYAREVIRTDPWIGALSAPLGLTEEQIDALWTWAAGL